MNTVRPVWAGQSGATRLFCPGIDVAKSQCMAHLQVGQRSFGGQRLK
nr:hypothetical protein [uncultured Ruegeria sp.]